MTRSVLCAGLLLGALLLPPGCSSESDEPATPAADTQAPGDQGGAADEGFAVQDDGTPPVGECTDQPDGIACDDGNACTTGSTCQSGVCAGGESVTCPNEAPCKTSTCDPEKGCEEEATADGAACTLSCFEEASCAGGECVGQKAVECPVPTETCVDQLVCDPGTGQCTKKVFEPEGAACNADDDKCTIDACDGAGQCTDTGEVDKCEAQQKNNPCWTWQCNKKSGCQQTLFSEGASCDDGNGCTIGDTCTDKGGKLCLGEQLDIDDENPCTDDKCVAGDISHLPLTGSKCALPSWNECTIGQCIAGTCDGTPAPDGTSCGAGMECTGGSCAESQCTPECGECQACEAASKKCLDMADGLACSDDANPCTVDQCSAGGCVHTPTANGTACGVDKACQGGACVETGPGDTCSAPGQVAYCDKTCPDYELPLKGCDGAKWGTCACLAFEKTHVDPAGTSGIDAGFGGKGAELWACYLTGKQVTIAHKAAGGSWSSALVAQGGGCAMATSESGVHMVYGKHEVSNHPKVTVGKLAGTTLAGPVQPEPGTDRNGYQPTIAARGGTLHVASAQIKGTGDYALRYFTQPAGGSWSAQVVTPLPDTTYDQSVTVCDNGTPVIAYLHYDGNDWSSRLAKGPEPWTTELLDDSSEKIGPGPVARCEGGKLYVVYQDFSAKKLRFAEGPQPGALTGLSKTSLPMENVGFNTDMVLYGGHIWVAFFETSGTVGLAVRPMAASSAWTAHTVASQDEWDAGALTGDAKLHIDDSGRPHVLFFGAFAGKDGPWVASID